MHGINPSEALAARAAASICLIISQSSIGRASKRRAKAVVASNWAAKLLSDQDVISRR